MPQDLLKECVPEWVLDNLDPETRSRLNTMAGEVQEADNQVLHFEQEVAGLAEAGLEIPSTMVLGGMRHYQRSIIQRTRLHQEIQMAGQQLLMEALLAEDE